MAFTPSDLQNQCIQLIKKWWKGEYIQKYPIGKVFILAGIAGSGKTTCVNTVVNELGLNLNEILFCTYTGMASSVLTRKGTPAQTIHRTIYQIKKIKDEKTNKSKFIYILKKPEELDGIKLIINDEWSMTPDDFINKMLTFNIPILFMGDPEQAPPVTGSNRLENYIDFFLDEPHRQALDNPIFWLANEIRLGNHIDFGFYGDNVKIVPRFKVSEEKLAYLMGRADHTLAGKNATVKYLNDIYRAYNLNIYPEDGQVLPTIGEKIMCLKNNWSEEIMLENGGTVNLVNGIVGTLEGIVESHEKARVKTIDFKPIFSDNHFKPVMMDEIPFVDERIDKKGENVFDYYPSLKYYRLDDSYSSLNYFDFAYASTVYKYQGSEANKVLYIEEICHRRTHRKILYTAVTRAKDGLIIIR